VLLLSSSAWTSLARSSGSADARRARVGNDAPQEIHPFHDDARPVDVAVASWFRRSLCAALVAGTPFMATAQPTDAPSAIAAPAPASEAAEGLGALVPSSVFLQAGAADHVDTLSLGAIWKLPWQRDVSFGRLSTSIEASVGEWQTHGRRHHTRPFAQLGFTPSLRFYPDALGGHWFDEAGIGANEIAPAYHTGGKRFSTAFNFGDHLAIGRELGAGHRQEIALRVEHFSNAGIDHPNPGENFVQVRWVVRY
jgi:lipid A 3-O-deacylase